MFESQLPYSSLALHSLRPPRRKWLLIALEVLKFSQKALWIFFVTIFYLFITFFPSFILWGWEEEEEEEVCLLIFLFFLNHIWLLFCLLVVYVPKKKSKQRRQQFGESQKILWPRVAKKVERTANNRYHAFAYQLKCHFTGLHLRIRLIFRIKPQ